MRFPPGFSNGKPGHACKLLRSLYGLKQSPRNWFAKLRTSLLTFVGPLRGDDLALCDRVKAHLRTWFKIKDLGHLKYFLGIEFAPSQFGLFLSQQKFALDILQECGLQGCKPAAYPMDPNHKLALADGLPYNDPKRYRRIIGRLVYLTITRPELSYAVHSLSQFSHNPMQLHFDATIRVLRYIKKNPGQGLLLRSDSDLLVRAYCDSDWASCPLTRKSVTGYYITLGHSPISWKTKKQHTISRSSAEAEYRAMAAAASELIWIKSFLSSLDLTHTEPMTLFCDSQSAIHIATNPVFHERTKHIELDCHFVREHILDKSISTQHIRTQSQPAYIMTKALGSKQFDFLVAKLGIASLHAPT
ncbi:uncharacterized mitochondrial protein AtMg00810-like [Gastrolobium bilobum]|uniref:uncharacterized mitochondrial protein AtMg00810-like n=1 Tax=Gastrolobium bilobum TaxID=150636 RepID=UPI002AB1A434|nr:uncharacterized mitochondrial protein AtMg00810-like [Gastrolobium bilobum]